MIDIYTFVEAVWLMWPAYGANGLCMLARGKRSIDGNRTFRRKPIFGPGKTWEGTIAGFFGAIIVSLLFIIPSPLALPLNYGQAIFIGLLVSIFGQLGDLTESLFKRNMGVKESGNSLPGHGGFLDRIDSVIFAGVVVYYCALAFNAGWS